MKRSELKRTTGLKPSITPLKRTTRIAPVSAQRKRDAVTYKRLRLEYLGANPLCQRCGALATDVHHSKGREAHYLDKTTFCGLCRPCHDWAHANPLAAKELGVSVSRLGVNEP